MKNSMCNAVEKTLVFPFPESQAVSFGYYALEGAGNRDSWTVRALTDVDFVRGGARIPANRLDERIRSFSGQAVLDSLCARERARIREDETRLGIAAVVRLDEDMYAPVPLDHMSITGAGQARYCMVRMPLDSCRYFVTDANGSPEHLKMDATQLRDMLLRPLEGDFRRFHMEVPSRCVVDEGKGVYVLLPEYRGMEGRLCLHCTKMASRYRKLKDMAFLDIPYNTNMEVRDLRSSRIYDMHGSILRRIAAGEYRYADCLEEVSVSFKAIMGMKKSGVELRMPQMWHVLYKDSVFSLPWTALSRPFRKSDEAMRLLLCSGMYELRDEGARYELAMEDLEEAVNGNEYRAEPRMYIKVPYRAVFRINTRSACVGLVFAGDVPDRKKFGPEDFSCILKVDSKYFRDERSIGGKIWLALPAGSTVDAWVAGSDAGARLTPVDIMRLLGALQKDMDSSVAARGVSAVRNVA